jgi:hypothetical protein
MDDIAVDYSIPTTGLAKDVLRACRDSSCLCSTFILFEALGLSNELTLGIEIDVSQGLYRSENDRGCQFCDTKFEYPPKETSRAILCLKNLCSSFGGHIYALSEGRGIEDPLAAPRSSDLHFTSCKPFSQKALTVEIEGSLRANKGPRTQDSRYKWQFSVESLFSIARLDANGRLKRIKMCLCSETSTRCNGCLHEYEDCKDTISTWWAPMNMQAEAPLSRTIHRNSACTLEPLFHCRIVRL